MPGFRNIVLLWRHNNTIPMEHYPRLTHRDFGFAMANRAAINTIGILVFLVMLGIAVGLFAPSVPVTPHTPTPEARLALANTHMPDARVQTQAHRDYLGTVVDAMRYLPRGCIAAADVGVPLRVLIADNTLAVNAHVTWASNATVSIPHRNITTGEWTRSYLAKSVNVTYLGPVLNRVDETWWGDKAACLQLAFPQPK